MGLNVAFGLTAFDGVSESIEDETIGTLKAYYLSWGISDVKVNGDSQGLSGFTEIPTRPC